MEIYRREEIERERGERHREGERGERDGEQWRHILREMKGILIKGKTEK